MLNFRFLSANLNGITDLSPALSVYSDSLLPAPLGAVDTTTQAKWILNTTKYKENDLYIFSTSVFSYYCIISKIRFQSRHP